MTSRPVSQAPGNLACGQRPAAEDGRDGHSDPGSPRFVRGRPLQLTRRRTGPWEAGGQASATRGSSLPGTGPSFDVGRSRCPRGPGLWGWRSDGGQRQAVHCRPCVAAAASPGPACWLRRLWEPQDASFPLSHWTLGWLGPHVARSAPKAKASPSQRDRADPGSLLVAILPPDPRSPAQTCQGQAASAPRYGGAKAGATPAGMRQCRAAWPLGAPLTPRPSRLVALLDSREPVGAQSLGPIEASTLPLWA